MKKTMVRAQIPLNNREVQALREALDIAPKNLNGLPYLRTMRRGQIERRRLSLVKADNQAPNLSESQELFRVCQWDRDEESFNTVAWAIRSVVTGDYFVYSKEW